VSAAVLDFFPIEGTRRSMREVAGLYRRFGHGDRVAWSEGYHKHQYSAENQAKAFAFLDRAFGLAPRAGLAEVKTLPAEALHCTKSGQVREELPGRSLLEVIREEFRERRLPARTLAEVYRASERAPDAWPVRPFDGTSPRDAVAWEAKGSDRVGNAVIDRYALHHAGGLVIPLVHVRRDGAPRGAVVLRVDLEGKIRASDWPAVEAWLDQGREVVSFDPRGLGETRMRYKAASIDDPELAPKDEAEAYRSPLSGILANHVYNAQLTGRPYLFELIDDVGIAARFARERLGARSLALDTPGDAALLGRAAAACLKDVPLAAAPFASAFSWKQAVETLREQWPIHYLVPDAARLLVDE
jgi:hypothetical protein